MYSIFQAEYRPIIISIEINEKIPPGILFYVNYDIDVQWNGDHFYGCSLDAAVQLFKRRDYVLVALEYNNAFFIPKNKVTAHLLELDIEDAYNRGYKNKPDREKLFGYNNEFTFWLEQSPIENMKSIDEYFSKYKGKYTLKLVSNEQTKSKKL